MVRSVKARHNRKTGRVAITFEVDQQTWANMGRAAENGAHLGTLDYVAGRINMAFLEDAPEPEPAPAEGAADDLDLDDGIPF